MSTDTRTQFVAAATKLYAERGFYGTSLAAVANELGMTKQTLLHHFGTKEKLYGEVLQHVCAPMIATVNAAQTLEAAFITIGELIGEAPENTQLLMRELLDNKRRAEDAHNWYLKPFLDRLLGLLREKPGLETLRDAEALTLIYQLLGAINYFAISKPTLSQMYGTETYSAMEKTYRASIERLLSTALEMQEEAETGA